MLVFETDSLKVFDIVDKVRQKVENLKIVNPKNHVSDYLTISIGVCIVTPSKKSSVYDALKIAYDALYDSKRSGCNKITLRYMP